MKALTLLLALATTSAFAQYVPVPVPDYCTGARVAPTLAAVKTVCENKIASFSSEERVSCELGKVQLWGCRATCTEGETLHSKLRMDVNADCLAGKASLTKTVIRYY